MIKPITPEIGEVVVVTNADMTEQPCIVGHGDAEPHPALASLGTNVALAVTVLARRRAIPLIRVAVRLRHTPDCQVDLEMILEGPLDESQRRFLTQVAVALQYTQ